jgi:hypothetical protein
VPADAQGALVALATPAGEPPDVDFVRYWHAFPGAGGRAAAAAHAQWVRRSAAAFNRPGGIVALWSDTAPAAVRAARAVDPAGRLATQGHVFPVADFLAVLVTEAVIHHLDMIDALPDAPRPAPQAIEIARATVDGLMAPDRLPEQWGQRAALLKATGRAGLTEADRRTLGPAAKKFPLLG